MDSRERVREILGKGRPDRTGFWLGHPHHEAMRGYEAAFGVNGRFELAGKVGDDLCQVSGDGAWKHPEGKPMFTLVNKGSGESHSPWHLFAGCEEASDVDRYVWPDPSNLDLAALDAGIRKVEEAGMAVFSGMWSMFFHTVADFFGMEGYFIKMHESPDAVHAVTRKVVDFYLSCNEAIYKEFAPRIDSYFLGNDFGTQLCSLIGPKEFDEFLLPYICELTGQAKRYGLFVTLHSCGSIYNLLPSIMRAGIDALNPIQALAADMDAVTLKEGYGDRLSFMGGIDTQQLLPYGTPEEVYAETVRVRDTLAPFAILSPSHEVLLPNVSAANVRAMVKAATGRDI
ncbi:MAG: hypothetical protein FWE70_08430 [Oscillospiraceae bacterium]|nr:hypothetical protein [Oscillospiraceae bacterium]